MYNPSHLVYFFSLFRYSPSFSFFFFLFHNFQHLDLEYWVWANLIGKILKAVFHLILCIWQISLSGRLVLINWLSCHFTFGLMIFMRLASIKFLYYSLREFSKKGKLPVLLIINLCKLTYDNFESFLLLLTTEWKFLLMINYRSYVIDTFDSMHIV